MSSSSLLPEVFVPKDASHEERAFVVNTLAEIPSWVVADDADDVESSASDTSDCPENCVAADGAEAEQEKRLAGYERVIQALNRCRQENREPCYREIERDTKVHHEIIARIYQEAHTLDGRGAGRRPALTERGEATLCLIIEGARRVHNISLKGDAVRRLCRNIWRFYNRDKIKSRSNTEHPMKMPTFGSHFFEGLRQRFPDFDFVAKPARGRDVERTNASNRRNVDAELESQKSAIAANMSVKYGGYVKAGFIIAVDETDVTMSGENGGGPRWVLRRQKAFSHSTKNSQHITAVIFTALSGEVMWKGFIVAGNPNVPYDLDRTDRVLQQGSAIHNTSGSIEKCDKMGNFGSWYKVMVDFIDRTDNRFGAYPVMRKEKIMIILDGCSSHHDPPTTKLLEEKGYFLHFLKPNLTHLLQLNDSSQLNGRLKGNLRKDMDELAEIFNGRPSLEYLLSETEKIIDGTFTGRAIRAAAESIGFEFKPGDFSQKYVRMTNASITRALDKMELAGVIFSDDYDGRPYTTRSNDFLARRGAAAARLDKPNLLPLSTSEAEFRFVQRQTDVLLHEHTAPRGEKGHRRVHVNKQADAGYKPDVITLTQDEKLAAAQQARAKDEQKKNKKNKTKKKVDKAKAKKRRKLEKDSGESQVLFFPLYNSY